MASSSDAVEAITLTGKEVSASIDAYLFDALYSVDGIFTKAIKWKLLLSAIIK